MLTKREHIVSCQNHLSGKCQLQIGAPQGSGFGPLLFIIYVNYMNWHIHLRYCNLYADDTILVATSLN